MKYSEEFGTLHQLRQALAWSRVFLGYDCKTGGTYVADKVKVRRRERVLAPISGESRVKQSFKEECDINSIMRKYEKHQVLTHVSKVEGRYGDFLAAPDFQQAQLAVLAAQEAFMSLPATVRRRFNNDAGEFVAFAQDPANLDEMRRMGLAKPEAPAPQDKAVTASAGSDVGDGEAVDGRTPASQKRAKGAGGSEGGA